MQIRTACVFVLFIGLALAQQGASPFYDYRAESPGTVHRITLGDLPAPGATRSATNFPIPYPRPAGAVPKTLPGFTVNLFVDGLDEPRELRTAPNGDVFLAETDNGEIKVFRGITKDGKPEQSATFATGLRQPFGIAFYPPGANPQWVYVG